MLEDVVMPKRRLDRHRRESLRAALENPHPETLRLAEIGFVEWARATGESGDLVDPRAGTAIRWCPKKGWVKGVRRPRSR